MNPSDPLEAIAHYLEAGPFGPEGPGSQNAIDVHAWRLRKLYAFLHKAGSRMLQHGTKRREEGLALLEQAAELDERAAYLLGQALDVARELAVYEDGSSPGGEGCGWAEEMGHGACARASNAERAEACRHRGALILGTGSCTCV